MNLPNVIVNLTEAQNNCDSLAYAGCFSETAVVLDEGSEYIGRIEIRKWIEAANRKYKTVMEVVDYSENETQSILTAKVSGTFDGSPVLLDYHLVITSDLIDHLEIRIKV